MKKTILLMLVVNMMTAEVIAQNSINCPPSNQSGVHIVQPGESLYSISRKYNISLADICKWNNKSVGDIIPICTALFVDKNKINNTTDTKTKDNSEVTSKTANTTTETNAVIKYRKQKGRVHVVQEGETLEGIANLYGYTLEHFIEINNFKNNEIITVGQGLVSSECVCPQSYDDPNNVDFIKGGKIEFVDENANEPTTTQKYSQRVISEEFDYDKIREAENKPNEIASKGSDNIETTTDDAPYMTNEERKMLDEINLVRANPSAYISFIQDYINYLKQNGDIGNSIATSKELIEELKKTNPLTILKPMQCVYNAAKKHGENQRPTGDINHQGTDGSWPWDRVLRECPSLKDGNENLVGGPSDVRRAVILLLVDEGIDNRGHRKTMLNPDWKYGACYKVGTVGSMPNCWVQQYAY